MICFAAHRHVLKTIPVRGCPRIYCYDNTPSGRGAWGRNSTRASQQRKRLRAAGTIPQMEYLSLDQALKALEG
jgi:hypothetical protein